MSWQRDFGAEVDLSTPCCFPELEVLAGSHVQLLPLQTDHADQLFESVGGEHNAILYDYMPYGPFTDIQAFRDHISKLAGSKDPQFYAISEPSTGELLGHVSFLRMDVNNRVIEIGHVLYASKLQRTIAATELQYLLASKAFGDGYRRLEWKCNSNNLASRRAALRLGYTFEGVFRQHMIVKGHNRDTAWYSITDAEWPLCKTALESWMEKTNFDQNGRQEKDLMALRSEMDGQA